MREVHIILMLAKGIQKLGINNLTDFQHKALSLILEGKNTLIAGESGSGKSLGALIGASESVLREDVRKPIENYLKDRSSEFLFSSQGYHQKIPQAHGTLVVVPTRELMLQTYTNLRTLAPELNVHRTSSMSDIAGVAKYFNNERVSSEMIRKQGFVNMVNSFNWNLLDFGISSPKVLNDIITHKEAMKAMEINPKIIILEECDLLLQ